MTRESINRKTKDAIMIEYNHRCSICGSDRPQIHHIDEDHANNAPENLLPLCPNCHLRDQHNPTRKIDIGKLKLFRIYKDPTILKSQFHPIYLRLQFLDSIEPGEDSTTNLVNQANELIEFISSFQMGDFYSKKLKELIGPLQWAFSMRIDGGPDPQFERQVLASNRAYREKLINNQAAAISIVVEQLRFQPWSHEA